MFLVNSRYPLVSATPSSSGREDLHHQGHTFSRSYGVNLPSSLASVLPCALGFSPRPPESVCGTVTKRLTTQLFLEAWNHRVTEPKLHLITSRGCLCVCGYCLLHRPPTCLNQHYRSRARPILLRPCLDQRLLSGTGILTCFPSPTPFGLGLGPD